MKHHPRRNKFPKHPVLLLEALESRTTPIVGAFSNAPITSDALYNGVVEIEANSGSGSGITVGTGTLLLNRTHILTATHVVTNDRGLALPGTVNFHLNTGSVVSIPFSANDVTLLPGYQPSENNVSPNDIALIRLTQSAPTGAPGFDLYRQNDEVGKVFTLVGFGNTGTGATGQQVNTTGEKRLGQNTFDMTTNVDSEKEFFRNLSSDFDNGTESANAIQRDFGISSNTGVFSGATLVETDTAQGDSGGPAFIQTASGLQIAGITNFGGSGDNGKFSSFGGLSSYARVSSFARAIDLAADVSLPARISTTLFAVGPGYAPGATATPIVQVYDAVNSQPTQPVKTILAYNPAFSGGIRLALGDVNGDGFVDIITAPGPGGGPNIKVFSGVDFSLINNFFAYEPEFTGGIYVGAGDLNGDGFDDILVGAGEGGGPRVRVFSGNGLGVLKDFFVYDPAFTGGVRVSAGLIDGDSIYDIITGAGPGGGPHVMAFSGLASAPFLSFFAYDAAFTGGVYVAAGGIGGSSLDRIVIGAGEGGGPNVRAFDALGNMSANFFAYPAGFTGGVRVSTGLLSPTSTSADFLTGVGPGGGPLVASENASGNPLSLALFAFNLDFSGGLFVAGRG
ncbi:MAG: trypsin-like serine protease [Gemmataceae bacterium]|nr:trypsin-like serine protease [Gemmataceae bacterium]